jgi:hypothetical protein
MKTLKKSALIAVLLASCSTSQAITNTTIAVSGTNIVLSWPSSGYEIYLVQSRQTLDPSDSWSCVTNAYPANGTNQTTFTIYGVVPPPATAANSNDGTNIDELPPSPDSASGSLMAEGMGPLVIRDDGSGSVVPLKLYPPGFDLSGFTIFDPSTGESVSGSGYAVSALSLDDPQPLDGGGSGSNDPPAVATQFFEVYHIPNFPAGITNYTFDGPTFIPVDFAAPDADPNYVDSTTVLINGQPTDYAQFMPYVISGVTNWGMGIYFDRFPNGTSTIQLLTTVRQSDSLNDQTPYIVFSNAPANITIQNLIAFTNWADLIFSNTYTFKAQTVSNVDWEIDIYDVNNNFVNYQTGHSSDGNIAWTWNFLDYWGNSRLDDSDPFFYPYITITGNLGNSVQNVGSEANSGSGSAGAWTPPLAGQFPSQGSWLFAYMDKIYDDGTTNYVGADYYYTNAIHTMEGYPWQWDIVAYDYPIKFGRTYSQADREASWQGTTNSSGLIDWLQYYPIRNFYYSGHGGTESIGADFNTVDNSNYVNGCAFSSSSSKSKLTSDWVKHNVTFNPYSGNMPYRFVFLDGCETANGGWPAAWGVPKQTAGPDWYRNPANNPTGARPNAFVGWDTEVGGPGWGTVDKSWEFRKEWMSNWAGTFQQQMNYAFEYARDNSGWVAPSQITGHLKEYGYIFMTFFEYNHSGDWP